MTNLVWDKLEDRKYQNGLDRGVLYLPDGTGVPWNGLTSVIENFDRETSPVYFDGMKINDLVVLGSFSATMKAITYPEEFVELEGLAPAKPGLFYSDQMPQAFGLCYRTVVNDTDGNVVSYRIHIVYNVTAIPNERTYETLKAEVSLSEFEWNIVAVPEETPGFRPTAHLIIETDKIDPWLLEDIEKILYGSSYAIARLLPMPELVEYISSWFRVQIIDNGDGTWTAIDRRDAFIHFGPEDGYFEITGANAVYIDENTYIISDTSSIFDVPEVLIIDNDDGTWTAQSDNPDIIVMTDVDEFEIRNANVDILSDSMYQISDTPAE